MKKIIIMTLAVLITTASFSQTNNKDEQAVQNIISTIQNGWNEKSGEKFASVFADVHDYIVVDGMYFSNFTRQGNAAAHQGLFNGVFKDVKVKLIVDKITFLRPDLALITAVGGRYTNEKPLPEDPEVIMTVIAEKKNNDWKIISFHNHNIEAALKKSSPVPLKVMYASWYKK